MSITNNIFENVPDISYADVPDRDIAHSERSQSDIESKFFNIENVDWLWDSKVLMKFNIGNKNQCVYGDPLRLIKNSQFIKNTWSKGEIVAIDLLANEYIEMFEFKIVWAWLNEMFDINILNDFLDEFYLEDDEKEIYNIDIKSKIVNNVLYFCNYFCVDIKSNIYTKCSETKIIYNRFLNPEPTNEFKTLIKTLDRGENDSEEYITIGKKRYIIDSNSRLITKKLIDRYTNKDEFNFITALNDNGEMYRTEKLSMDDIELIDYMKLDIKIAAKKIKKGPYKDKGYFIIDNFKVIFNPELRVVEKILNSINDNNIEVSEELKQKINLTNVIC